MGNKVSKLCADCFMSVEEQNYSPVEHLDSPLQNSEDFLDTNLFEGSNRKNSSQNWDAKILPVYQEIASLATQPPEDLNQICSKEGVAVFGKEIPEGFHIQAEWLIDYDPKEYIGFFRNIDYRLSWDKNLESIEIVEKIDSNTFVEHLTIKKAIGVSKRDMLLLTKFLETDKGCVLVSKSCEHNSKPIDSNVVRATMMVAGYYIEEFGDRYKVTNVTKGHFGGSVPSSIIKKMTGLAIPKLVKALNSAYEKHRSN